MGDEPISDSRLWLSTPGYLLLMLASHPKGVVVTTWVVPGASRDEVVGEHDGALKVRTVAPAEGGKANRRVAELVAQAAGGRRGDILSGAASRRKQVVVFGVTLAEASVALGISRPDP